jgi:hypothetical protein
MENKKLNKAQVSESSGDKFMLEEYIQLNEERRTATDHAETRVNFFFAICSAAVGAIVVLGQTSSVPTINWERITIVVLAILLLYGLSLLNRITYRDIRHQRIDLLLMEVQNHFSEQNQKIETYLQKKRTPLLLGKTKSVRQIGGFLGGGLISIVILTNSLICGGMVFTVLLVNGASSIMLLSWSIFAIVVSAILFQSYYGWIYSVFTKITRAR